MKYLYLIALMLLLLPCLGADTSNKKDIEINKKIEVLTSDLQSTKKEILEKTINSYEQTNDRLNNYLTFTGIVAGMFGVIIALGGIWIGFESLKSQKRRDEAIKILEDAKAYVENKKLEFNLLVEGKVSELENDYKKIIEISKDRLLQDINSETLRVKELAEKKTLEIEEFSIQEKNDETIETLQKRIEFFENISIPDDPKILFSKASLLRGKEMYKEAIELLLKVVDKEPDWNIYWELGYDYAKLGDSEKAIDSYQKSIKLKDDSGSHNNLGVLYEKQNKLYDALQEYETAIKLAPEKYLYYNNKAKTLLKLNSVEPAIETYKSIIELNKAELAGYKDLANLLEANDKYELALEYYDLAILNIPDKTTELNYLKGQFLQRTNKKNEALILFQTLLPLNFKTEECLQFISQIKLDMGEKVEAVKILDSIIELNIKNSYAYLKKAEIYLGENPDLAMSTIDEGAKNIDSFSYFLNAARVFSKNGMYEFAKKVHLAAIPILIKHTEKHDETDIMNLYETYITVDDNANAIKVIDENRKHIKSIKYQLLDEFLTLCIKLIDSQVVDINIEIEKFKYLKSKTTEKSSWNFDDMTYYINSLDKENVSKIILPLISYLKDEITFDDFKQKLV